MYVDDLAIQIITDCSINKQLALIDSTVEDRCATIYVCLHREKLIILNLASEEKSTLE